MSENSKLVVYQVNIALIENPKIWRMINIPQNYTLSDLHISIQCAMGWTNVHMYEFKISNINSNRETIIGIPDDEYPSAEGFLDSRITNISDIFDEEEMIKLLNLLIKQYSREKTIYFSWDAASWHASKALYTAVDEINTPEYRENHKCPKVILAPLPTCAQFLNVIESVFSGMAVIINIQW